LVAGIPVSLPIRLQAARVTGVGAEAGGILANLTVAGTLKIDAKAITGNDLALSSDKLKGKLLLRVDLVTGRYDMALTGGLTRYLIPGLGIVDVNTKLTVLPGPNGIGSIVSGTGQAIVRRFDNQFLRTLAGGEPRHRYQARPQHRWRPPFLQHRPHRPVDPHHRQRASGGATAASSSAAPARRRRTARSASRSMA
jgi:hypothetical protein